MDIATETQKSNSCWENYWKDGTIKLNYKFLIDWARSLWETLTYIT